MLTKRGLIVGLVGINLFLMGLLSFTVLSLPAAFAQTGGRGGNFVTVTAKPSGQSYDVLFALDISNRKLHAFHPGSAQGRPIVHAGFRDLEADFARSAAAPVNP